jgi:osmotically-inducible protein OsmY
MPRISTLVSYLVAGLLVSIAGRAHGQTTSGAGGAGMFGGRSVGSSFAAAPSNFSGSAGARTAAAGAAGGLGALGMNGVGGSLAGATTRGDAAAGQVTGNERFLRNNRQAGQFVGSDSADTSNFFSQLSGLAATQGARGQNNQQNTNNVRLMPSKARVLVTPGFSVTMPSGDRVSTTLQQRLEKSQRIGRLGPISVRLEGRTAVLSGSVATEHDRDLAAQVALLEAGVAAVRNELSVGPPPSPEVPLPNLPSQPTPTAPNGSSTPAPR